MGSHAAVPRALLRNPPTPRVLRPRRRATVAPLPAVVGAECDHDLVLDTRVVDYDPPMLRAFLSGNEGRRLAVVRRMGSQPQARPARARRLGRPDRGRGEGAGWRRLCRPVEPPRGAKPARRRPALATKRGPPAP